MSFFTYDLAFLIAFSLFLIIFLYLRKKNLKREGILFLYRTKLGIKIINYVGTKYKGFLLKFEIILCVIGYALMAASVYLISYVVYVFSRPEFVKAVKIPPLMPLIPYIPEIFKVDFLPPLYFTYWIIALLITATPHEFFHGIFARINGVGIKSTGFAFMGPIAGAFVEPDEIKRKKLSPRKQIPFLCAGTFANLIVGILFFIIMWIFFTSFFIPSGMIFNSYSLGIVNVSDIKIGGEKIYIDYNGGLNLTSIDVNNETYFMPNRLLDDLDEYDSGYAIVYQDTPALRAGLSGIIIELNRIKISDRKDLAFALNQTKPGDEIIIKTINNKEIKEYNITLAENPDDKEKAYLGVASTDSESVGVIRTVILKLSFFRDPSTYYAPEYASDFINFIYFLIWWIVIINFSVAIMNMLPLGIFDGGQVFYLTVLSVSKSEKIAKKAYRISTGIFLFIFILLMFLWFRSMFLI